MQRVYNDREDEVPKEVGSSAPFVAHSGELVCLKGLILPLWIASGRIKNRPHMGPVFSKLKFVW